MRKALAKIITVLLVLVLSVAAVACTPTNFPSPSTTPSTEPSTLPSESPSTSPSVTPSNTPTTTPSVSPSVTPSEPPVEPSVSAFVTLDINPSVEFTVDEAGVVVSVYGANDDAKILLYEQSAEIVGKDVEEAVEYLVNLATQMGYLTDENSDVGTTVTAKDDTAGEALKDMIDAKIVSTAEATGISVTMKVDTAFKVLRELDELKARYTDNESMQNLTPEKFRLVASATESGALAVQVAVEMSNDELIDEINKAHGVLESYATEAYMEAKARAVALFETSMGVISDSVYTQIYTARAPKIPTNLSYVNTIHYGAMYQAYKTTARTYACIREIMLFADEYLDYVLPSDTVEAIATALELSDIVALKNEAGDVTLGTVISFTENFIDTHDVAPEVKDTVLDIIAEAKATAEIVVMASDSYAFELETLKNSVQVVIAEVAAVADTILNFLPATAKAEFEACLAELQAGGAKIDDMMENGDTSVAIIALAEEAEAKAQEVLDRINEDLTEDEIVVAEGLLAEKAMEIEALTNQFEDRLAIAEVVAKQYIADARAERQAEEQ